MANSINLANYDKYKCEYGTPNILLIIWDFVLRRKTQTKS